MYIFVYRYIVHTLLQCKQILLLLYEQLQAIIYISNRRPVDQEHLQTLQHLPLEMSTIELTPSVNQAPWITCQKSWVPSLSASDTFPLPYHMRPAHSVFVTLFHCHIRWDLLTLWHLASFFTLWLWHLSNATFGEAGSISACDTSRLTHQVRLLHSMTVTLVKCHIRWGWLNQCLWHFSADTSGETSSLYACDTCQMAHLVRQAQSVLVKLLDCHIRWGFFAQCLRYLFFPATSEAQAEDLIRACRPATLLSPIKLNIITFYILEGILLSGRAVNYKW